MKHINPHIKVVLFDHDDTLVGTIEAKWAAHKFVAKKHYNKNLSEDEIREHWGKPLRVLVGLLYDTDDVDTAIDREMATHKDFPKILLEDTKQVLAQLRKSGKKLGVITATSRRSFEFDLSTMKIPKSMFDYTQTEEGSEYHKPDSRVFDPTKKWLSRHGIKPSEVVYVADGLHDMKAALGAGFEFIGVSTGLVTQADFKKSGARSIRTLGDLISQ